MTECFNSRAPFRFQEGCVLQGEYKQAELSQMLDGCESIYIFSPFTVMIFVDLRGKYMSKRGFFFP